MINISYNQYPRYLFEKKANELSFNSYHRFHESKYQQDTLNFNLCNSTEFEGFFRAKFSNRTYFAELGTTTEPTNLIYNLEDTLVYISIFSFTIMVDIAGESIEKIFERKVYISYAIQEFIEKFHNPPEENRAQLFVWLFDGKQAIKKFIHFNSARFEEIEDNYPGEIAKRIKCIINNGLDSDNRKLIFWSGEPGTGKTWAIRSLALELQKAEKPTTFHLVTDPENLFKDPRYINDILSSCEQGPNLIVLEDTPNALLTSARDNDSYNMSRVLNLTDGIWGQSLNVKFLMTTNSDFDDIDPAFLRDGRCLQMLKFRAFNEKEGKQWLIDNGVPVEDWPKSKDGKYVLSSLFAARNRTEADILESKTETAIGF